MEPPRAKSVGLVLSGGGARGFAHIGVLRALERRGIDIDVIAGTSMGAILGAFYASGMTSDEIQRLTSEVSWRDVIDLSLGSGLFKGDKLEQFLAKNLPSDFCDLHKPLAVTTTDIESGEEVVIMDGALRRAVRASSSFPGAFEPIVIGNRTLADGGIVNNLPISAVGLLGATATIASDATPPRRAVYTSPSDEGHWWERMMATVRLERRNPMAQMMLRSTDIMQSILTDIQYTLHPADVLIQLDMPDVRIESFRRFEQIVELGEQAAERALAATDLLRFRDDAHATRR